MRTTLILSVGLLATAGALVACQHASVSRVATPLRVAIINDTSGAQAALGGDATRGAELAFRAAANIGAGLDSAQFDSESLPSRAAEQGAHAATECALGIGFTDSDTALAGVPPFTKSGEPFLVIGATDPTLPTRCGEGTFLVCFGDDAQAIAAAEFGASTFGKRAALVFDSRHDYASTLAKFFRSHFTTKLSGEIASEVDLASGGASSVTTALAAAGKNIDFIYAAIQPEEIEGVLRAVRAALPTLAIIGGDSFDLPAIRKLDGAPMSRFWFTTHAWLGEGASPDAAAFVAAFERQFGCAPTAFAALGYDAANLLVNARGRAASDTPAALMRAIAATRDFPGITGTIDYEEGPVPQKDVWVVEVVAGEFRLAKKWSPVTAGK